MPEYELARAARRTRIAFSNGRDFEHLSALNIVLTDESGTHPVILTELLDSGLSLIDKFEKAAAECCHAVVLLSPDEYSRSPEGDHVWQPRGKAVPKAKTDIRATNGSECKQVCIALVVPRCGMPKGYEMSDGDGQDSTTVEKIVKTMKSRCGQSNHVWVM